LQALLKERWGDYSDFQYLLEEDGVDIADDGTVTVDAVRWKTHKVTRPRLLKFFAELWQDILWTLDSFWF